MAIFVFALAVILAACGGSALIASVNLVPTEVGLLYATCGVMALCACAVTAAIGALIVRVDRIGHRIGHALAEEEAVPFLDAHPVPVAPAPAPAPEPERAAEFEQDEALNENRVGHLPTLADIEETITHPEPPPRLIGRYSAGGANYAIFSDGSVEAEIAEGQFSFASMHDFRAFLEQRRAERPA